jgi:tRNA pseudouridine38-40 synthase
MCDNAVMARVKLVLEYDGTDYVGWQVQPNGPSVQAVVETALERLSGAPVPVEAAGRTDAGVHAEGQVIAFTPPKLLPMSAYVRGLNALLPADVAVVEGVAVLDAFDPRRWARGKRYRYRIDNRPFRSALSRRQSTSVFGSLDVEAMQQALNYVRGRHDFSSFRASDCQAATAVRELFAARVEGQSSGHISLVFEGTAFLKHMVRNLVGSALEVGRGKRPPAWLGEVLVARQRTLAGPTAPPQGLTLEAVFYDANLEAPSA